MNSKLIENQLYMAKKSYEQGEYDLAKEMYESILATNLDEPNMLLAYTGIANVYEVVEDYKTALNYYSKSLKYAIHNKNTKSIINSYVNMGRVYHNMGDNLKSMECLTKALELQKNTSYDIDTDYAETLNNIADIYIEFGEYENALAYYSKALQTIKNRNGEDDNKTAIIYNNMGLLYSSMGYFEKSLLYCNKALMAFEKALGASHLDTATAYNNIGAVYYSIGDNNKALSYYGKAHLILEKILGKNHPSTINVQNNIKMIMNHNLSI
jgi:tetratricopeptide (TPR) repeat protein